MAVVIHSLPGLMVASPVFSCVNATWGDCSEPELSVKSFQERLSASFLSAMRDEGGGQARLLTA
jgi:hypothetical protein